MFKYIKAFFNGAYKVLFYYPRIRKYYKHKDKYPLEERYAFARKIIEIILKALKTNYVLEGFEKINKDENYMIVCNHQSMTDALSMIYLFDKPVSIIAKKEILKYPFVGKINSFIDGVFIDRENIRDAVRVLKVSKENLANGINVAVFPEGTRTRDPNYMAGEYKGGSFKPVYEVNKKILVLASDESYKVLSKKYPWKQTVKASVIDIIEPERYLKMSSNDLAKYVETITNEKLKEFRKQKV